MCSDEYDKTESGRIRGEGTRRPEQTMTGFPDPAVGMADRTPKERQFGPYRVIREIGRGGMGIVFLVEQNEPVQRRAALKVIQYSGDAQTRAAFLSRFRSECQLLARLKHPNIAVVYDAGQSESGEPYLVLELLEGRTIVDYCNHNRLDVPARLEIFIDVCRGVQHAHQRGIIHRDLKPSNIIVVEEGGQAIPKIIDFGVAKEINADSSMTIQGELLGSPGFMSPEMLVGGAGEVDSRTDVYSLGAILYQLLVDDPPFSLGEESLVQFLMRMVHEEPQEPSRWLRAKGAEASSVAKLRGCEAESLGKTLLGDLDWITMMAMSKDRERRYGTASELAEDVSRYLGCQPVSASPLGRWYRIRKTLKRHRLAFAVSVALVFSLFAATLTTTVAMVKATRSEKRAIVSERAASREAERTRVINLFLEQLLSSMDPSQDGRDVKLVDLVDRKATELDKVFAAQPEIEASIRQILGSTYMNLGDYEASREQLEAALDLRAAHLGIKHPHTIESRNALARLLLYRGNFDGAVEMARETVSVLDGMKADGDEPLRLQSQVVLGESLYKDGDVQGAYDIFSSTLVAFEQVLGRDHPDIVATRSGMAQALKSLRRVPEAESIYRIVLAQQRTLLGPLHPETLRAQNALANTLFLQEHYAEAEALYRETLVAFQEVLGPDHKATLLTLNNIGNVLYKNGRYDEAEDTYRQTVEAQRRILGEKHPDTLVSLNNLANALRRQRRFKEAERIYRVTLVEQTVQLGPGHDETIRTALNLSRVLYATGRYSEVIEISDRLISHRPDLEDPVERKVGALLAAGRPAEAVGPLRALVGRFPDSFELRSRLGLALLLSGRAPEAIAEYRGALDLSPTAEQIKEQALAPLRDAVERGGEPPQLAEVENLLSRQPAD